MMPRDRPPAAVPATLEARRGPGGQQVGTQRPRGYRNGLAIVPYQWRARAYPWAQAAIAAAEARHGAPGRVARDPLSQAVRDASRRWRQRRRAGG